MPFGKLKVYLEGAVGIKDTALFGKGSPYCTLTSGTQVFSTPPVEEGGTNPYFNTAFEFHIDRSTNELQVDVFRKRSLTGLAGADDDLLGSCTISFKQAFYHGHETPVKPYDVTRPSGRQGGQIRLSLTFFAQRRPEGYKELTAPLLQPRPRPPQHPSPGSPGPYPGALPRAPGPPPQAAARVNAAQPQQNAAAGGAAGAAMGVFFNKVGGALVSAAMGALLGSDEEGGDEGASFASFDNVETEEPTFDHTCEEEAVHVEEAVYFEEQPAEDYEPTYDESTTTGEDPNANPNADSNQDNPPNDANGGPPPGSAYAWGAPGPRGRGRGRGPPPMRGRGVPGRGPPRGGRGPARGAPMRGGRAPMRGSRGGRGPVARGGPPPMRGRPSPSPE